MRTHRVVPWVCIWTTFTPSERQTNWNCLVLLRFCFPKSFVMLWILWKTWLDIYVQPFEKLGKKPEHTVKHKYQGVSDLFEFHYKYWYAFLIKAYQERYRENLPASLNFHISNLARLEWSFVISVSNIKMEKYHTYKPEELVKGL